MDHICAKHNAGTVTFIKQQVHGSGRELTVGVSFDVQNEGNEALHYI